MRGDPSGGIHLLRDMTLVMPVILALFDEEHELSTPVAPDAPETVPPSGLYLNVAHSQETHLIKDLIQIFVSSYTIKSTEYTES